jgi:hypothetical protein
VLQYARLARFGEQVQRYVDRFPARQVLVLQQSDWVSDPRAAYRRILDFLGLQDDRRGDFPRFNETAEPRSQLLHSIILGRTEAERKLRSLLDRIPTVKNQSLLRRLRRWNRRPAISAPMTDALRNQIDDCMRDDQQRLRHLLERLG